MWPAMMNKKTNSHPASPLSKTRPLNDLRADWKRWTLAERVTAVMLVSIVLLSALAASTPMAFGGH